MSSSGKRSHAGKSVNVGIVGAGQLARMTYQAGISLGLTVRLLAERQDDAAARVGADVALGSPRSRDRLESFARKCDVVTFDHELVDSGALADLEQTGVVFRPSGALVSLGQNKRRQREELERLGFPVPPYQPVTNLDDVVAFAMTYGWPVILKAARGGYDGRGVWSVTDERAASAVLAAASQRQLQMIVERRVKIDRELAVLVARRPSGDTVLYPAVETVQVDGICREIIAPAPIPPALLDEAHCLARRVATATGATGIMALELFESDGRLLINELALRPHNSGHYSIEGCVISQFENHLRAVLDWPLGDSALVQPAVVTVNVLGDATGADPRERLPLVLGLADVHVHLYGKEARPRRKLGHVTVVGQDPAATRQRARDAAALLTAGVTDGETA